MKSIVHLAAAFLFAAIAEARDYVTFDVQDLPEDCQSALETSNALINDFYDYFAVVQDQWESVTPSRKQGLYRSLERRASTLETALAHVNSSCYQSPNALIWVNRQLDTIDYVLQR